MGLLAGVRRVYHEAANVLSGRLEVGLMSMSGWLWDTRLRISHFSHDEAR